ncbi:MAG: hypothetical protein JWR42_1432 [Marmoricola sp.]|nr:hypothetical protein [Marmoricola sp.]
MSSTTASPGTRGPAGTIDLSEHRAVPFSTLTKVELRKSYDTRAGFWLLLVTAILTAVAMVVVLVVGATQDTALSLGTFIGTTAYTSSFLLPVLGIMLVTGEWGQRTAMVTFTLEPHRSRVILAKLVAGLLLALGVALVAMLAAVLATALYSLTSAGSTWELGEVSIWGFLLSQLFAMLTGFALATLLLNTAAAIVVYFAYGFVLPVLFVLGANFIGWFADLRPWIDFADAQRPLFDGSMSGDGWAHLLVSGLLWLGVPLTLGLWRVLRAEVK